MEALFADGINVHFVLADGDDALTQVAWERGAGVPRPVAPAPRAAAAAANRWALVGDDVTVTMPGGSGAGAARRSCDPDRTVGVDRRPDGACMSAPPRHGPSARDAWDAAVDRRGEEADRAGLRRRGVDDDVLDDVADEVTRVDELAVESHHRGAFGEFGGESDAFIERTFRESIVLVGVSVPRPRRRRRGALDELALLVDTAGADEVGRVVQRRDRPDPATYIGKGKVEEIARCAGRSTATPSCSTTS